MNGLSDFRTRGALARLALTGCLMLSLAIAPYSAEAYTPLRSPFSVPYMPKGQKKPSEGNCETPPAPMMTLATQSMYKQNDPTRSHKDPKAYERYKKMIEPLREYGRQVARSANKYVRSGAMRSNDAICTVDWLYSWAAEDALSDLKTPQAYFNLSQIVSGFAFAYMEVRDNPYLSKDKKTIVEQWLGRQGNRMRDHMAGLEAKGMNSAYNNHRYWIGLGVGAAGVAAGDPGLLQWGLDSARLGLKEIQPDGTLPREVKRASRARDYHIFAVAPLVMLAELGRANGADLYHEQGDSLQRLVKRILLSYDDSSYFDKLTGREQVEFPDGEDSIPNTRLGWLEPYHKLFPSEESEDILDDKRPVASTALGGNMTLLYTGEDE